MSEDPHIGVLVDQWLVYLRHRKGRATSTVDTYRSVLGFFVEYANDCPVSQLSVDLIDAYAESLIKQRLAPKTYRNKLIPIRSFVNYLFIKEYTNIHPDRIETPPDVSEEANFLTEDEQARMIAACKNIKEKLLICFLINSGVRVSELVNLKYDDVYQRSVLVKHGKGNKNRVTFINHDTERLFVDFHVLNPSEYAFPNRNGGQISRQYVARTVSEIAVRAGIAKEISPHTLRHTFGTMMITKGASIEEVQQMMGHANIRTTLIYLHFTNEYLHGRYDEVNGAKTRDKTEIVLTKSQISKIKNSDSASFILTK